MKKLSIFLILLLLMSCSSANKKSSKKTQTSTAAAAEVQIQARPVLADVPREGTRTAFEVQCFSDRINRSSCRTAPGHYDR